MPAIKELNLKCPSCGSVTKKTLSEIKSQREFSCECGYYAELISRPMPNKSTTASSKKEAVA